MATAGDGRAPYESGGGGEKLHKRLLRSEMYEEPQNVSQEAGQINSSGVSDQGGNFAATGISELEQTSKQMTFTRSEAKHLIALVHSRTMEESPSSVLRLETSKTSGSLKNIEDGDDKDNSHAPISCSRVVEEQIASPLELPKAPMASMQHPASMENLPDELLSNIFIRLLAKQLARMRSVSKSWNSLLSQSSFVNSHLRRSIQNNDQILLVFYRYNKFISDFKPFAAFPSRSPHPELTNFIKLPANPRPEYTNGITVIGCVNGLICSRYGASALQIWNPSLSAVSTLPPYSMPSGHYPIKIVFRFGFDPKTNDYKVVKLMGPRRYSPLAVFWWLRVEVFSMRKGLWELITDRFPSHITWIFDDVVCVDGIDGHLCWLGHYIIDKRHYDTIVAFDMGSESFREIPLPDSILNNFDYEVNKIGVLAGKHCLMTRIGVDRFEVWVMEEYGVVESWVKRHVFSHFIGKIVQFGFISHNGFLLYDSGRLVLYDPIANKTEILENFHPGACCIDKIAEYVDSLVWVAPDEPKMVDG